MKTSWYHYTQDAVCNGLKRKVKYAIKMTAYVTSGLLWVFLSNPSFANPTDGAVEAGQATISTPNPTTVQVQQSSDKAVINWQTFNINASEKTQFIQPSSSSIVVNRINPANGASTILGNLSANGQVWLLNPAGIMFGAGSRVDVAGLLATTAGISTADFMAGNYHFIQSPSWNGAIINNGFITIASQGMAALVAPGVENNGVIQANLGHVVLAAGTEYTLDANINNTTLVGNLTSNIIITTTSAGTDTGNITISAPISWASATSLTLTAANNIAINAAISDSAAGTLILNAAGNVTQTAAIGGSLKLTQQGAGTLTLSQANTYTGLTTVSARTVEATNAAGLGTTAAGTTISSGAVVDINGVAVGAEAFTINGTGTGNGALTGTGTSSLSGAVTLGSASSIGANSGAAFTLSGGITGTQNLTLVGAGSGTESGVIGISTGTLTVNGSGSGTWTLGNSANTYTGITTVSGGKLNFATIANQNSNSSIGKGTVLINGGTLSYTGASANNISRNISVGSNGGTFQVATSGTTLTLNGTLNVSGSGGGANPLTIAVNQGSLSLLNSMTVGTALST